MTLPVHKIHHAATRAECLDRTRHGSRCRWEKTFEGESDVASYAEACQAAQEHAKEAGHLTVASQFVTLREWFAEGEEAVEGRGGL